ncbi:L-tyrosine/L-tryptophan isonitrile synthase family protein [Allosaccharopolyspora coralli]|uniref:L-tyrosine/L-tryptophan isonitrile synthase family protein n=1 Tax=Allosaccharopolyspora coralli TaxID=2665642 RepID=A0A5Q3QBT2_9PSEU|nr:L-tyrosine/L-tryptophan isonitrile synthase family protein [Allosaccharopolyspora coralli]
MDPHDAERLLSDGGYGLRLTRTAAGLRLDGAGRGVPLGEEPTWLDLHRVLARLRRRRARHDPHWLARLSAAVRLGRTPRFDAVRTGDLHTRWQVLQSAVHADPALRMHCALRWSETALEPAPVHPMHPGGTVIVDLAALVTGGPERGKGLLGEVVEHRDEHREHPLGHFLEYVVRPLVRIFRTALDDHGIALGELRGIGYELTTELQSTGRVVLTPRALADASPAAAATSLAATVATLTESFGQTYGQDVRAAADEVFAQEFRYLRSGTAKLLRGDHPLREHAHCVTDEQDDLLKAVLRTVQDRTRVRRWHPERPRPTVVVDVDQCSLVPVEPTREATTAISGPRSGAPRGIPELAAPDTLPTWPTTVSSTWDSFLDGTELRGRYPDVDWEALRVEFGHAFDRARDRPEPESVVPGVARFVWDVLDAGGRVLFCAPERLGEHVETVLAESGVPDASVLSVPDDDRPAAERKVELLRGQGPLDVVAVFDDLAANRRALAEAYPGARCVAVEIDGFATERPPGEPTPDGAGVISSFETSPRRLGRRNTTGPALSHAHSLEELQVGQLRTGKIARRFTVHLDHDESLSFVEQILADTDRAAERTAGNARRLHQPDGPDGDDTDSTLRAVHHVLTRKQFLKGSRSHYRPDDLRRDAHVPVRAGEPINVVVLGFPVKQCLNRLKALGPLPDLAELGAFVRLRELDRAVSAVHPPGIHLHILTDGRHFRPRPAALTDAYTDQLRRYLRLAGIDDRTTLRPIDDVARDSLGVDAVARRPARIAHLVARLYETVDDLDITDRPLRTLEAVVTRTPPPGPDSEALGRSLAMFRDMLMSVVYSVPVPQPRGTDPISWSVRVFSDLYDLTSGRVPAEVRSARAAVLRRAWHTVVRYLATLRVDEELGYEQMFDHRVRLTVSAALPGRCGFTYLGGSGLLPWQGTGVVDPRGHVAVDFAVSLLDQGFVPVYSDLLGPRQPWAMVPADHTHPKPGGGLALDSAVVPRLRRK